MALATESRIKLHNNRLGVERRPRSVLDELLIAFHFACDIKEFDIARGLISIAEGSAALTESVGSDKQRAVSSVVAAHERLWALSHEGETLNGKFSALAF